MREAEVVADRSQTPMSLEGMASDEVRVDAVMHPGLIFCAPESPLRHAARLMARHRVHAIVVLGDDEEGGLWGVVSDADLVDAIAERDLGTHTAGGMARTPLVTISHGDTVARAAELMRTHGVTHLLVVNRGNRPIGVVSTLDLARATAEGLTDRPRRPVRAEGSTKEEP